MEDITRTIKLSEREIVLDSRDLGFNESNISKFIEEIGRQYDFTAEMLAQSELERDVYEERYDRIYAEKYVQHKENSTDKLAEAKVKLEMEVQEAQKMLIAARHRVSQIKGRVKALDKAHDAAMNRGNTLRREMDKLNSDIFKATHD